MKSFKLDQYGDVVITNNKIELVEGIELVVQTLRQVINTNLGEWFGDESEGTDHRLILTKNPNYELVQDTINTAVQQVADSLSVELETDHFTFATKGRCLTVSFIIKMDAKESAEVTVEL